MAAFVCTPSTRLNQIFFALNFLRTDLTDSGNSLTDMRNKLTFGCLPGQKREIKTLLGSDDLTGFKGGGNQKSMKLDSI
jgi:hypothetical protein